MCGIVAMHATEAIVSQDLLGGRRAVWRTAGRMPGASGSRRRARRAGPCPAEHHRPRDRRSADRQRGRVDADRGQRRVLRLRADPPRPGGDGATASARDRTARSPSTSTRSYGTQCLHHLRGEFAFVAVGRAEPDALRRPRPLRDQAAVLRRPRERTVPGLRGEGPLRPGRPGAWDRQGVFLSSLR